ncbi:ankyrin repeat domain-containing protein [Helicobacter sp. 23-1045]
MGALCNSAIFARNGAEIHATNNDGKTALHFAIEFQNCDIIRLLIERNANINTKAKNGWNVLMVAVACKDRDLIDFVLWRGSLQIDMLLICDAIELARELNYADMEDYLYSQADMDLWKYWSFYI